MLATQMEDELPDLDVTGLDRADLIQRIRELERQRSAWELRVRACQERESLYLQFVKDLGDFLAVSFQMFHETTSTQAAKAGQLIETIREVARKVEEL